MPANRKTTTTASEPTENLRSVHRPTRAIVDRGAIRSNASIIRDQLSPQTQLMAVVKANGYGHGALVASRAAIAGGATFLGVATIDEACELRQAGIDVPVLVLGASDPEEAPKAAQYEISLGVGDVRQIEQVLREFETRADILQLTVHLKIDTGMHRFGVAPDQATELATKLANHPRVRLNGVYSHFAESDGENLESMHQQFECFQSALAAIDSLGIDRGLAHISNSAGILRNRSTDLDMVRAGICLYGIAPSQHAPLFEGMRSALEWRATIEHITELEPGDRVGYGGTYVASEHERVGLVPVGYADGYPRALSNKGWVVYDSDRLPIRGRISMDQCSIGIPDRVPVSVGDEIILLGDPELGAPGANQLGELAGTIGYEIVSRISRRVPFEYK